MVRSQLTRLFQNRSSLFAALGLALLAYLLFFHRLGGIGLVGPDEPRYAQIAREMMDSGNYITPRLFHEPWLEKPVLFYWGAALACKIWGVGEASVRLTSALSGLLGLIFLFFVGKDFISKSGGFIATAILASSILYFSLARAASMDMLLTVCLLGAWSGLYFSLFENGDLPKSGWRRFKIPQLGLYAFLGLSVLAKGPVGIVLLGAVFCLHLLLSRRWVLFSKLWLFPGLLVFLLVALPWYWLCYRENGFVFIEQFLIQHNLERFTTDRYQHSQPLWFYGAVLGAGFFPWIFHLPTSLHHAWRNLKKLPHTRDGRELFIWLWILVPFLFFSFSRSKLPGYILPAIPPLSLLIAREYTRIKDGSGDSSEIKWFNLMSYLQAGALIFLAIYSPISGITGKLDIEPQHLILPSTTLLIMGLAVAYFTFRHRIGGLLACQWAGMAVIVLYLSLAVFPFADRKESQRQFSDFLKRESGWHGQPVYLFYLSRRVEYGLDFYLNQKTRSIYSWEELEKGKGREIFVITARSAQVALPDANAGISSRQVWMDKQVFRVELR